MGGRYVPPGARQSQGAADASGAATSNSGTTGEEATARSLEQLSISHPGGNSYDGRFRGRGRGRGRGDARGGWAGRRHEFRARQDGDIMYREIHQHYWSPKDTQTNAEDAKGDATKEERSVWAVPDGTDFTARRSTLNDSLERRDELVYVVLFKDANPKWESDQVIYAHTNIDILPGYEDAYNNPGLVDMDEESSAAFAASQANNSPASPVDEEQSNSDNDELGNADVVPEQSVPEEVQNSKATTRAQCEAGIPAASDTTAATTTLQGRPVAIYSQTSSGRDCNTVYFHFMGWHNLDKVDFIQPRSKALAKMLADKWDIKDRFGRSRNVTRKRTAWLTSMNQRWAILKFTKIEEQDAAPDIKKIVEEDIPKSLPGNVANKLGGAAAGEATSVGNRDGF